MNETDFDSAHARIRRLETRQRRTLVTAGCGAAMLLVAMAQRPQDAAGRRDVLEVGELRVVHDGVTRIRLGVDEDGAASIVIQDPSGTRRVALVAPVGAPSRVELFGQDGEPQPLIEQVASEAHALGKEAVQDLEREVRRAVGTEVDRLRDALSDWRTKLGGEGEARPVEGGAATLVMRIVAEPGDPGVDLAEEAKRLHAWLAEHPEARTDPGAIGRFNALAADAGGPAIEGVRWFPHVIGPSVDDPVRWQVPMTRLGGSSAVAAFDDRAWNDGRVSPGVERLIEYVPLRMDLPSFTGADLDRDRIRVGLDDSGRPALTYRMRPERQSAYADWSEAHVGRFAAIVIDGRVVSAPRFMGRILGAAQITGNFTEREIEDLARRLRGDGR